MEIFAIFHEVFAFVLVANLAAFRFISNNPCANAVGLSPSSIRRTHIDRVSLSRPVFSKSAMSSTTFLNLTIHFLCFSKDVFLLKYTFHGFYVVAVVYSRTRLICVNRHFLYLRYDVREILAF